MNKKRVILLLKTVSKCVVPVDVSLFVLFEVSLSLNCKSFMFFSLLYSQNSFSFTFLSSLIDLFLSFTWKTTCILITPSATSSIDHSFLTIDLGENNCHGKKSQTCQSLRKSTCHFYQWV